MPDLLTLGAYASAALGIISFITFVVSPIFKSFTEITKSLTEVTHTLKELNSEIVNSKEDRKDIHETLKNS